VKVIAEKRSTNYKLTEKWNKHTSEKSTDKLARE